MTDKNQTPEEKARDNIDKMLELAGWKVQDKKSINFNAGLEKGDLDGKVVWLAVIEAIKELQDASPPEDGSPIN